MHDTARRFLVYGAACGICAALILTTSLYKPDADLMTLVNGAEVRLRLASSMPRKDKQGRDVVARDTLVLQAREQLDKAEKLDGETTAIAELRAFAFWVQGDCEGAATAYAHAQVIRDCSAEMRDGMIVNESRMWRAAGNPERALAALDKQPAYCREQRLPYELERMHAFADSGRSEEGKTLAKRIALADGQSASARLEAGECLQRLQDLDAAEQAFELVRKQDNEGTYALARLKLARGQVDTSLDLLNEFVNRDGEKAKARIQSDASTWQAVASDERFRSISKGVASAPVSGR